MHSEARAVWFTAERAVEIRSAPVRQPTRGEVRVRTLFSGISPGTEMLAYRGQVDPDLVLDETIGALGGTFEYPFRYGYSAVGVVEESEADLSVGSPVFAFHPHQEEFTIPAEDVIPIGDHPAREATLYPLVETALQISLDAALAPGERTVVMGLGPVGALTSVLLARSGVRVVGVDPLPWRRAVVERAGEPGLTLVEPEALSSTIEDSEGPVSLVVDASGSPDALRAGLRSLSHEGTLLVASWFGSAEVPLPLGEDFHRKRLSIRSTQVSSIPQRLQGEWDVPKRRKVVLEMLGELPLSVLATHSFAFDDAPEAYAAIDEPREGLMHTALAYV